MKPLGLLFSFLLVQLNVAGQEIDKLGYYRTGWKSFYLKPEVNKIIDARNPDYEILDAAIFHATNEIRENHNLPLFNYAPALHQSSEMHSSNMIKDDFFGHNNEKNPKYYKLENRIRAVGGNFKIFAENIAQFQIVKTSYYYCPDQKRNGEYQYLNCETNKAFPVYTYLEYAKMVVKNWYESPSHKSNLLNIKFNKLGCAARISKDPFKARTAPFARLTQNFAGGEPPLLIQVKFVER